MGGCHPRALHRALAGPCHAGPDQQRDCLDARHVPELRQYRRRVQPGADRPIDSIDQTDFLFGNQEKSSRESVIFFYGGELLSVKWRNYKIHFSVRRTSRGDVRNPGQQEITSEVVKPTYPWMFDIENDPKELWNIASANTWVGTAIAKRVGAPYAESLKGHPNLKPGAEGPAESDPTPTELPPMDDKD